MGNCTGEQAGIEALRMPAASPQPARLAAGEGAGRWLVLFVKSPVEGQVKTRLHSELGVAQATALYRAFLSDAVYLCRRVSCECRVLSLLECGASEPGFRPAGFVFRAQSGLDMGERLGETIDWAFCQGAESVVVIGADSPSLPCSYADEAFTILKARQAVLGPCWDGGYYLIGFSAPCRQKLEGIHWGTDRVLSETTHRLGSLKVSYGLLPPWYDVDRPYDLEFLKSQVIGAGSAESDLPCPATRRFLLDLQTEVGYGMRAALGGRQTCGPWSLECCAPGGGGPENRHGA